MQTISKLIADKALFVINHSGGKDSQAMMIKMLELNIPRDQMLVVHATLGEVEHHGALELAQKQAKDAGIEFRVATAHYLDGSEKTLLNMVERQFARRPEVPSFPSKSARYCTSDLKRGPITRVTLGYMKERKLKLVVNCEGLRAAESPDRSKLIPFVDLNKVLDKNGKIKSALAKAGRQAFNYLPIHEMSTDEVFATIKAAGQEPHAAYAAGSQRLSCVFCIFGSKNDLALGAKMRPDLFAKYVELEERTGYTMHMSRKSLTELVADASSFDVSEPSFEFTACGNY